MAVTSVEQQIFVRFISELRRIGDLVVLELLRPYTRQRKLGARKAAADGCRRSQGNRRCKREAVDTNHTILKACRQTCSGKGTCQNTIRTSLARARGRSSKLVERCVLGFIYVTRTYRQTQFIGEVKNVMREHRPAACILVKPVFGIVAIGIDRNAGIAKRGQCEQRVDPCRIGKVERATSLLEISIERHRLVSADFLARVETTDQPVEAIIESGALQAQLLGKGLDMVTRWQNAGA